jgi:hypothetical protein
MFEYLYVQIFILKFLLRVLFCNLFAEIYDFVIKPMLQKIFQLEIESLFFQNINNSLID